MSNQAILIENLSKSYRLGQIGTGTLTNDLKVWWAKKRGLPNPLLKIGQTDHGNRDGEELWALRDLSFKVEQGEVLGIIGRNGAGKSTLLKILSRVTAPTAGCVKVRGRIASLLEVGTGFHPELTGRENIYLNGAILGMSKQEITRKFDEIVAFAEVEKFIDTPVKRYSSGMYVRLAFAVAAHLESEILLVDEVLAVGDVEFQKKCLGKMGDVASKEGRTVLFVSHNMASIGSLCKNSLLLIKGEFEYKGISEDVINYYLLRPMRTTAVFTEKHSNNDKLIKVIDTYLTDRNGMKLLDLRTGQEIIINLEYEISKQALERVVCIINVKTALGQPLFSFNTRTTGNYLTLLGPIGKIKCKIPMIPLNYGSYFFDIIIKRGSDPKDIILEIERAIDIQVSAGDFFGTGYSANQLSSPILVNHNWDIEKL